MKYRKEIEIKRDEALLTWIELDIVGEGEVLQLLELGGVQGPEPALDVRCRFTAVLNELKKNEGKKRWMNEKKRKKGMFEWIDDEWRNEQIINEGMNV